VPIIPAGFAQVDVMFDAPGQGTDDAHCLYGIQAALYDDGLANDLFAFWADNILTEQASSWALTAVEITTSDGSNFQSDAAIVGGGKTGAAEQPQVCVLVRKLSASGGRANKGRFYVPGIDADDFSDEGVLDTSARTAWQNGFNDWYAAHGAGDIGIVILHSVAGAPTDVTGMQVTGAVATQRRRGPRG
jgi:hypothetical protein